MSTNDPSSGPQVFSEYRVRIL